MNATSANIYQVLEAFERAFRDPSAKKLLKPRWLKEHDKPGTPPSMGFCYIASEALFHMLGGSASGWRPVRAGYTEDGEDKDHWWLEHDNETLDPTVSQFTDQGKSPPYAIGKPRSFMTAKCSARAQELAAIVERLMKPPAHPKEKSMGHKINRDEFLNVLGRVSPGISKKGTVEQSSCFVFDQGWLSTFNDEICCRTESGLPDTITAAVHAEELLRWVENVNDDELEVWVDGSLFRIRAGRKKTGIRMESEIVLPIDEVSLPEEWFPLPAEFTDGVRQVKGAAGSSVDEFMVRCIHVHPNYVEACDRNQFIRYELKTGVSRSFLVQAASLANIVSLDLTLIGETPDWVHFRNQRLIFSVRQHLEDYPTDNITEALKKFNGLPCKLPKGAEVAARLGAIFAGDDKDSRVTVQLKDNQMVVRGQGPRGWSEVPLDMNYTGSDVAFRIAPSHLGQIVDDYEECEISERRLRVSGERWVYLTRLGDPATVESTASTSPVESADEQYADDEED